VRLHGSGLLIDGAEDGEKLIVGEEVESGKRRSLLVQIIRQPLLHHAEQLVAVLQLLQQRRVVAEGKHVRVRVHLRHDQTPGLQEQRERERKEKTNQK
jgi:hypothetical protein